MVHIQNSITATRGMKPPPRLSLFQKPLSNFFGGKNITMSGPIITFHFLSARVNKRLSLYVAIERIAK